MKEFIFGTYVYEYEIMRQERSTLSLTVTPECRIILKCPLQADDLRIERFLQRKWFWLEKQLSFFKKYQRKVYEREYISGESYLYLGRQYKLVVNEGDIDFASLAKGRFMVQTTRGVSDNIHNKQIINQWLKEKSCTLFQKRLNEMILRFDYDQKPNLIIREMKKRWGSFINQEKIILNPKLIHTPKECIDYVITHELCHLEHKNHSTNFFKLLDEKYPKWEKAKEKLEVIGAGLC